MKITSETLLRLAAGVAAGSITEEYVRENYGSGVLALLAGGGAGLVVDAVASPVLRELNRHTGLVDVADSVIDAVNPFNWF